MILVRDIFHLKFGKAKDAKALFSEGISLAKKHGFGNIRILSDFVTGHSYTFVQESTWENLASWEDSAKSGMGSEDFHKWYQQFIPLCESASREIFSIVEL